MRRPVVLVGHTRWVLDPRVAGVRARPADAHTRGRSHMAWFPRERASDPLMSVSADTTATLLIVYP